LVNGGLASASDFVRVTSTEAARIFNLYPRKGVLAVGSDADVIVFDPNEVHTLSAKTAHGRSDTSLWERRAVRGRVVSTVSRGRLLWHEGVLHAEEARGSGRFVPVRPFGGLYDGLLPLREAAATAAARDFPPPVRRAGDEDAGAGAEEEAGASGAAASSAAGEL
jgi:dihydropyrimidinase